MTTDGKVLRRMIDQIQEVGERLLSEPDLFSHLVWKPRDCVPVNALDHPGEAIGEFIELIRFQVDLLNAEGKNQCWAFGSDHRSLTQIDVVQQSMSVGGMGGTYLFSNIVQKHVVAELSDEHILACHELLPALLLRAYKLADHKFPSGRLSRKDSISLLHAIEEVINGHVLRKQLSSILKVDSSVLDNFEEIRDCELPIAFVVAVDRFLMEFN